MKVIITFTFCCDNQWKSKFMLWKSLENSGNFLLILCGHPVKFLDPDPASGFMNPGPESRPGSPVKCN